MSTKSELTPEAAMQSVSDYEKKIRSVELQNAKAKGEIKAREEQIQEGLKKLNILAEDTDKVLKDMNTKIDELKNKVTKFVLKLGNEDSRYA